MEFDPELEDDLRAWVEKVDKPIDEEPWTEGQIRDKRQHVTAQQRRSVLGVHRYICVYCGGKADTVDHIVPVAKGGGRRNSNLAASCYECNKAKGVMTVEEFRASGYVPQPAST